MGLTPDNPQYREKVAIWTVLSNLSIYAQLADSKIWRWFAANIPNDLGTGGHEATDFDIVVGTLDMPRSSTTKLYRAFEVKVAVMDADGRARSLKAGKTGRTINQVTAYQNFGVPESSLLDVFLCHPEFMRKGRFPTKEVYVTTIERAARLHQIGAGYRVMAFQMAPGVDPRSLPGLTAIMLSDKGSWLSPHEFGIRLTEPRSQPPSERFQRLAERLDDFGSHHAIPFKHQIVYCRKCHQLQAIDMKTQHTCPNCDDNLIEQC